MSDRKESRREFAVAALTGLLANPDTERRLGSAAARQSTTYIELLAKVCFSIAEAMEHEESHR